MHLSCDLFQCRLIIGTRDEKPDRLGHPLIVLVLLCELLLQIEPSISFSAPRSQPESCGMSLGQLQVDPRHVTLPLGSPTEDPGLSVADAPLHIHDSRAMILPPDDLHQKEATVDVAAASFLLRRSQSQ